MKKILIILTLTFAIWAVEIGDYAPSMALDNHDICGTAEGEFTSADFYKHDVSVVVFWGTYCNECMDAFVTVWSEDDFFERSGVPIATFCLNDLTDKAEAKSFCRDCPYPVYFDYDASKAKLWNAHMYNYIAYVLGKDGRVLDILEESYEKAGEDLKYAVMDALNKEDKEIDSKLIPVNNVVKNISSAFSVSGFGKFAYLYNFVQDSLQGHGAYGETITQGSKYSLRVEPDFVYKPIEQLSIGLSLRLYSFPSSYLVGSPDYVSDYRYRPWAEFNYKNKFKVRAGYYKYYNSPLTLMRWDENDNPPGLGGSEGGCRSCDGLPGGMATESLEEIAPELGLEGLKLDYFMNDNISMNAFYAKTQSYAGCYVYDKNIAGYGITYKKNRNTYLKLFGMYSNHYEADCALSMYPPVKEYALDAFTISISEGIKLWDFLSVNAEYAYYHKTFSFVGDSSSRPDSSLYNDGSHAGYLTLGIDKAIKKHNITLDGSYIYLENNFDPEYRAISYESNMGGFRARMSYTYENNLGIVGFAKFMHEIEAPEPLWDYYDSKKMLLGTGVFKRCYVMEDFSILYSINYSYEEKNLEIETIDITSFKHNETHKRYVFSPSITLEHMKDFSLSLNAQIIGLEESEETDDNLMIFHSDYDENTSTVSLILTTYF